jgi:hypothetical protein
VLRVSCCIRSKEAGELPLIYFGVNIGLNSFYKILGRWFV